MLDLARLELRPQVRVLLHVDALDARDSLQAERELIAPPKLAARG
jgi:hypothetical protein